MIVETRRQSVNSIEDVCQMILKPPHHMPDAGLPVYAAESSPKGAHLNKPCTLRNKAATKKNRKSFTCLPHFHIPL